MKKGASLTPFEKRIVKRLIADGERNQDVHVLVNIGRQPTVNFGRFSGSPQWPEEPASDEEVARFRYEKSVVDLKTGLSPFEDERLYKAREAMLVAVECFNRPSLNFKLELFAVISQIAWTYVLHEYYDRLGVKIVKANGKSIAISEMLDRSDFPLKGDVQKNLRAVKAIRDDAEHRILNAFGSSFYSLFQANCLNFDQAIRQLFGNQTGLSDQLSLAIQFSKMTLDQLAKLQKFDISPQIEAIEQKVAEAAGETGNEGVNYKFKVNFSLVSSSKGEANIQFFNDNTGAISNVLVKKVAADELWPFKPMSVVGAVAQKTGKEFTSHLHQLAWKKFAVRPASDASNKDACNKKYCTYHPSHGDYTYSQEWVNLLAGVVDDPNEYAELQSYDPKT